MGQGIYRENCVDLSTLPEDDYKALTEEAYTVLRTDGRIQSGWRIPVDPHICNGTPYWAASHACDMLDNGKAWRFFLLTDTCEVKGHVCGWRQCEQGTRTFWPTRLTTNEEKEIWWKWLDERVNTLNIIGPKPIEELFKSLKEKSPLHEKRARRLLDNGCPKNIVANICQIKSNEMRVMSFDREEVGMGLMPME